MFEAKMTQGNQLKKIVEALRELVNDTNIDCSENGIQLQAMDTSHVSLCQLMLRNDGFDSFRCDRNLRLGLSLANLSKILKCAGNDDVITLSAQDEAEVLNLLFEGQGTDRTSEFQLNLMDIDAEHLGIPDTEYKCNIKMPSSEFQRIVRDVTTIGDTCVIQCTKEGVKFSVEGDLGQGSIMVRANSSVDKEDDQVVINMEEPVTLSFALRYLNFFTKATPLGKTVILSMSPELPLVVEYPIDQTGHVRYFLAPKIDDDEGVNDDEEEDIKP